MKKRGASLIWALVMSASLLFIAVTMASFVIRESQMSVRMDESSRAYAAAESGIEWGKYCVESLTLCDNSYQSPVFNLGGSQYTVKITVGPQTIIESLGTSNGVNRKLEYIINPGNILQEVSDPRSSTFTVGGSYVQQFDYWIGGAPAANIGVGNSNGSKAIYFKHIDDGIFLEAKNDTNIRTSQKITTTSLGINDAYALQIRIEYFKDLSAKMTVSKRTFGGISGLACVSPTLVLDLRNFEVGSSDFTKFYYGPLVIPAEITNPVGNGFVYTISQGTNIAYFDNMATIGMIHPIPPKTYTLAVNVDRINWGTVTATGTTLNCGNGGTICSVQIEENKEITLTAVGNGRIFDTWSGTFCTDPKSTSCVIKASNVNSNIGITATFK